MAKHAHLICIFSTRTDSFHIVVRKYLFFYTISDMRKILERSDLAILGFLCDC